jgi:hypothetical protein
MQAGRESRGIGGTGVLRLGGGHGAAERGKRRSFNPKRSIRSQSDAPDVLRDLSRRVSYGGNPEHKKHPGDFGLQPLNLPRLGKALCDSVWIFSRAEARRLLRDGMRKGLVSSQQRGRLAPEYLGGNGRRRGTARSAA